MDIVPNKLYLIQDILIDVVETFITYIVKLNFNT